MAAVEQPTGPLLGDRVALRPFRVSDAADVARSCAEPDIPRYTMMHAGLTEADARVWIERRTALWANGLCSFALTVPPADRCLGQMGVHIDHAHRRAETFYWLDSEARGQGLATEGLDVLTLWVFDNHDVVRVHLITHLDNDASQSVATRAGYHREGVLRAWEPVKDDQPDVVMWSRLATDPSP